LATGLTDDVGVAALEVVVDDVAALVVDDVLAAADVVDLKVAAFVVDVVTFDVPDLAAPCCRAPLLQLYNVGL